MAVLDFVQIVGLAVAVLAVLLTWRSIREISRHNRYQSFMEYQKLWDDSVDNRRWVRYNLTDHTHMSREDEAVVRDVVDVLNKVGLLIEEGLISPRLAMTMNATEIIRLTHRLVPFIGAETANSGAPYGQRVVRLGVRARRYFDVRPTMRGSVRLHNPDGSEELAHVFDPVRWGTLRARAEIRVRCWLSVY